MAMPTMAENQQHVADEAETRRVLHHEPKRKRKEDRIMAPGVNHICRVHQRVMRKERTLPPCFLKQPQPLFELHHVQAAGHGGVNIVRPQPAQAEIDAQKDRRSDDFKRNRTPTPRGTVGLTPAGIPGVPARVRATEHWEAVHCRSGRRPSLSREVTSQPNYSRRSCRSRKQIRVLDSRHMLPPA